MYKPRLTGYTVIELVIVILIVGIVSAFAMARILRGDSYNSAVISDQIISMARSAQQKAIGRNDVTLVLQPVGNDLAIRVQDSSGVVQTATMAMSSTQLYADVNVLLSCSTLPVGGLVSNSTPMVLNFSSLGDIVTGGIGGALTINTGARICVTPDVALSVCISAAGFAYRGDCLE